MLPMSLFGLYNTQFYYNACGWWGGADYVLSWRKERYFPPLVTTSPTGTAQDSAGVLGLSTTSILFGDEDIGNSPQSGVRVDVGIWATRVLGFGTSVIGLGTEKKGYTSNSNSSGSPIIARPFFNVSTSAQDAELIGYPAVQTNGAIDINTTNRIWGGDIYARYHRFGTRRWSADFLLGFNYLQVTDNLDISTETTASGTITRRNDHFHCRNNYYAGLLGAEVEWASPIVILSVRAKVGVGNNISVTDIRGHSVTGSTHSAGGLLALPTNIDRHSRHTFEVVPQLNARLRLVAKGHFFVQVGYDMIYWPKVAFSGEQVDLNLNITQQDSGTLSGTHAPIFNLNNKDFWAQGIAAGIYFTY